MNRSACKVKAWEESVVIPTYPVPAADMNPMFLEKRVYQGSTGKVYPNPFVDRVSNEKSDKSYRAVFLENEFLRLMILPEIGGRIHVGQDKTNGYDLFYRQNVIKPALVGLLGPWISGGVEFNWPQHHRPSTYMPVQYTIEYSDDGSATVWLSEHEPMQRTKGMVGICIHPGKSYIEAKVRLYNRTPFVQTFLWWANVGIRVHDEYQAFFPPDVTYVADHAKRAVSSYPIARNFYYGVDYRKGVDISWYKNIPVPTSYMVTESQYDFFGGYDHTKKAGVVHFANRHIAPGKKLWTWGNADFGYAWDRNLTDEDGPYIELMAGVFTDNQPDFSWIHPYETRTWSQFWYPIQEIGPAKNANRQMAVNLEQSGGRVKAGVCVTEALTNLVVVLSSKQGTIFEKKVDLAPGRPFVHEHPLKDDQQLFLRVLDSKGNELIRYSPPERKEATRLPDPATEPLPPGEIESADELYVTGLHLEQYRHATRYPEPYWEEALRRDPLDSRCNTQMGLLKLRRGQFAEAEQHLRKAIERLTRRNPNPAEGEAYYYLGVTLQYQGRMDEAYGAYYKAAWNYSWQSAAYYRIAEIECIRRNWHAALEHIDRALLTSANHLKARNVKTAILRTLGRKAEAEAYAQETVAVDPLDLWARSELLLLSDEKAKADAERDLLASLMHGDPQLYLDIAFDYAAVGLFSEASEFIQRLLKRSVTVSPMLYYALGSFAEKVGDTTKASEYRHKAAGISPDYCFPARIEEMLLLESAVSSNPKDSKAHYYLGNLYYDKKRYEEAIGAWEASVERNASFSIPWRNLGIAYVNIRKDEDLAKVAYEKAFEVNSDDARLLYELDQLYKRTGVPAAKRLSMLEKHPALVARRDDLNVEIITLYNQVGRPEKALEMLRERRFNPWEGGEGLVSGQYVWAHLLLGRSLLERGEAQKALEHFEAARNYPHNLGEGKHLLTSEKHLDYFSGLALQQQGRTEEARKAWTRAAEDGSSISAMTYYQAMALAALGRREESHAVIEQLRTFAQKQADAEVKIDYFATSLPNFLLFEDDLHKRNRVDCLFMLALADLAANKQEQAAAEMRDVLALDGNHLAAQTELQYLDSAVASTKTARH
ncbi:MAG TPA: DUF5107 domain-containing protein [Terriglobales bacterium]|nr:DUF5107 domain-containing protein [Terriglobales bacterium]